MSRYNGDSYRPNNRRQQPPSNGADSMFRFGGSHPPPRRNFGFRARVAERDLLTHVPTQNETPVFGPGQPERKYRNVDDMTDSEEEEMDEDFSDEGADRAKRRKTTAGLEPVQTPKWSNPDPYTALPPPSQETATKKVDFVKLIRKARNESAAQMLDSTQDDFISFGDLGEDPNMPPLNAPAGPRSTVPSRPAPIPHVQANPTPKHSRPKKRKRGEDDDDDGESLHGSFHLDGRKLAEWRPVASLSPAPWLKLHQENDTALIALHKEILDFYAWVRPQQYEAALREDLIRRLERELKRCRSGIRLEPFGSYAAGLYLPTGDMDLVCLVSAYPMDGFPIPKQLMFQLARHLENTGFVRCGTMVVLWKARVPILKFVDDATGLKVDLSFNNTTGTRAIETFKAWSAEYPAMPVLVSVVKQFLMLRGLNDNAFGGLGGFAIICLVTSLLQNYPSPSKNPTLGELLVEFFNLYGNMFNISGVVIRLDPPSYLDKESYRPFQHEKSDRLCIVDPNSPDNNITGGSREVGRIFSFFSEAHSDLCSVLDLYEGQKLAAQSTSLLADLIGGNFTAYQSQREQLHRLYAQSFASRGYSQLPPPVALPTSLPMAPPPPPSAPAPTMLTPPPPPAVPAVIHSSTSKTKQAQKKQSIAVYSPTTMPQTTQPSLAPTSSQNSVTSESELTTKAMKKLLSKVRAYYPDLIPQLEGQSMLRPEDVTELCGFDSLQDLRMELAKRGRQQDNTATPIDNLLDRIRTLFPEKDVFSRQVPSSMKTLLLMGGWRDQNALDKQIHKKKLQARKELRGAV